MSAEEELKKLKRAQRRKERRAAKAKEVKKAKPAKTTALTTPASAAKATPKTMAAAREGLMQAFENLGGVDGLTEFGEAYPKEFYALWGRMIPKAEATAPTQGLEDLLAKLDAATEQPSAEDVTRYALNDVAPGNETIQ